MKCRRFIVRTARSWAVANDKTSSSGKRLFGLPGFKHRQHIVTQMSKFGDVWQREVFVRVQPGQR